MSRPKRTTAWSKQQIDCDYRQQLSAERNKIYTQAQKLEQDVAKQAHHQSLLELKATQDSVVKDLATHASGTVVQPGTVRLPLVLKGEVWSVMKISVLYFRACS